MANLFVRKPLQALLDEMHGEHRLHRVLGPVQLSSLGVGAIIGTGIFVLTGVAAHDDAGPALMLSFVVAGLTCIFAALCYAEFASMVPVAGSAYTYAYATLGELFAWIIGWDLVLEYAVGLVDRRPRLVALLPGLPATSSASTLPHVVTQRAVRLRPGHRRSSSSTGTCFDLPAIVITVARHDRPGHGDQGERAFNAVMVIVKVAVVLFVIVVGAFYVNPANWTPFAPFG